MSVYDFEINPRSWTFTGEIRAVELPKRWWFGRRPIGQQWIFEKTGLDQLADRFEYNVIRIGVMIDNGRVVIQDPPAGE